jgi:hypothetical protein
VRRAETNVVGKDHGAEHVAVTVHRVDAEHQRYRDATWAGRQGGRVEAARELQPLEWRRTIIAIRTAIAAGENRAERVARQVFRHDRADVGLDDLPDFLLETHAFEQLVDARFGRRIHQTPAVRLRPVLRMHRIGQCLQRSAHARAEDRCRGPHRGKPSAPAFLDHDRIAFDVRDCAGARAIQRWLRKSRYHAPLFFRRRC